MLNLWSDGPSSLFVRETILDYGQQTTHNQAFFSPRFPNKKGRRTTWLQAKAAAETVINRPWFFFFFSQSDLLSWQLSWNRSKLLIELTGQSPLRNSEKSAKVSKKWRPWSQGNLWTWMNNNEIYVLFGSSSMAGRMRALCLSLTSNWKTRRWDWHPGNSRQWVPALNSLVMWVNCWFSALLWDVFLPVLQCYLSIKNIS